MAFKEKNLIELARLAVKNKVSDIHLRTDEAPCFRVRGDLVPVQTKEFSYDDIKTICSIITNDPEFHSRLDKCNELDGSYEIESICRIRFNLFKYCGKLGIVFRLISAIVPTLEELNVSKALPKISMRKHGLILVTGATGSGKSTTLAAMINHINENQTKHILTIEDPIEFIHAQKKSRITQREIAVDTDNFSTGLRSAMRQDPDIILIGEMRDPETIAIALKAAETGHLVFSTLHTTNAVTTIGRIISMFPDEEQDSLKKRLAENLYATIGQRLLKGTEKNKLVVAQEIMVTSPAIKDCILGKSPMSEINNIIRTAAQSNRLGSQDFDGHVAKLLNQGLIDNETAKESVSSESDFLKSQLMD